MKFYAHNLSPEAREMIRNCLQLIKFGMSATLLTFRDKYYEYGGGEEAKNRGLTIGGYESAWLADLAMAYVLEKTKKHFKKAKFYGVY